MSEGLVLIVTGLAILFASLFILSRKGPSAGIIKRYRARTNARDKVLAKYPNDLAKHYKYRWGTAIGSRDERAKYTFMSKPLDSRFIKIKNEIKRSRPSLISRNESIISQLFGLLLIAVVVIVSIYLIVRGINLLDS